MPSPQLPKNSFRSIPFSEDAFVAAIQNTEAYRSPAAN